jgi:hypothetical protein
MRRQNIQFGPVFGHSAPGDFDALVPSNFTISSSDNGLVVSSFLIISLSMSFTLVFDTSVPLAV